MKIFKKIIFFFALTLLVWGCESRVEDIEPEDNLSTDAVFSNFVNLEAAVIGVYDGLQDGDLIGTPDFIADFTSDNVDFVGSFTTLQDIRDFDADATNGTIDNIWFDVFDVTRDANNIIVNLENINADDVQGAPANFDALAIQFIAEARFCRALAYLVGVNNFAQPFQVDNGNTLGMPIVTEFFEGDVEPFQQPRSTVNETHAFIEADLLFAMNNLPASNGIRASSTAARGLLSRLYLYREQWAAAANMANDVVNTTGFSLASDFSFYNNTSSEHLFQVINQPDDPAIGSDFDTFYNPTSNNGRGDLPIAQDLIDAFEAEPTDLRFTVLTFSDVDAGNNPGLFTNKYPNGATNESDPNVIRMGEIHLNRAEANLRGGTTIGATPLEDVNAIRARAGLPALGSVTLDDILLERRKELAFEGARRMDLLRNNQNLKPGGGAVTAPGANFVILPIPDDELNGNPNAQQNPGY
ncbi:putative outer membrane starch-binding protein [Flagellimonas meridianipacifica]|uniref:Putative outer membrane starch-binding protein n=2 Tax=Flagellimonas meridianipacifica TaxID=1080225 RepID=A0A2T0MEM0_9FLAO|nr:putative outer membrane starch-binding protein [Allomuricauda pacifica]